MKKKALTLAIAAALSAPASFAATDSEGMQYTRASEGFYGRIATKVESKRVKNGKSDIGFDAVRVGVRGTNDMGGGLEGFYRWEGNVSSGNGSSFGSGRLAHWGVRGAFGQVQVGSFWTADYSFVHQADHVGVGEGAAGTYYDNDSGNDGVGARQGRSSGESLEYKTPDLNGFQGAVRLSTNRHSNSDSTVGLWNLAARYEIQGFTVGASYNVVKDALTKTEAQPYRAAAQADNSDVAPARCLAADGTFSNGAVNHDQTSNPSGHATTGNRCAPGLTTVVSAVDGTPAVDERAPIAGVYEDLKTWSLGLGYAQDNWSVGGWYGTDNYGDKASDLEDSKTLTLGGRVDIGKVGVFANWQKTDNFEGAKGVKRTYGGVGVGYTFTQQTGVTGTYRLRSWDDQKGKADEAQNYFRLVMHHAF